MSKTLIGMVTFGNLPFSRLAIEEIKNTTTKPFEFLIIVGKPGDVDTIEYLKSKDIPYIEHEENYGFPYSLNDLYERAFVSSDYDNLIIVGNDVIAYPTTIDSMIETADTTHFVWVSALQYDVKSLVRDYPQTSKYFDTNTNFKFSDFTARPWDAFTGWGAEKYPSTPGLSDIHNLALYKKEVFDTIGYVDVNFYPAYYSDNDYARRGVNSELSHVSCTLMNSYYFHFWSRTIHQETGGSTNKYFGLNKNYYISKWGGDFGREKYLVPFGNGDLAIRDRSGEKNIVNYWKEKGK